MFEKFEFCMYLISCFHFFLEHSVQMVIHTLPLNVSIFSCRRRACTYFILVVVVFFCQYKINIYFLRSFSAYSIFNKNINKLRHSLNLTLNVQKGNITEKAVWRSLFLTLYYYILSSDSTNPTSPELVFNVFAMSLGVEPFNVQ